MLGDIFAELLGAGAGDFFFGAGAGAGAFFLVFFWQHSTFLAAASAPVTPMVSGFALRTKSFPQAN